MQDQTQEQDIATEQHDRYFGLDPKVCFYCKQPTASRESEYVAELRKNLKVSVGITSTKTQYKEIQVPVPRCAECKKKHKGANTFLNVFLIAGIAAGMYVGHEVGGGLRIMMFLWGFIGVCVGAIVGVILRSVFRPKGTKQNDDSDLEQHPLIAELLQEGYK